MARRTSRHLTRREPAKAHPPRASKNKILWAAIFDWDGVIIDSSRQHQKSWEILAAEERRHLPPDHLKRGFGMKNEVIIPQILNWTDDANEIRRLGLRKEEIYRQIVRAEGTEPLPGVREFLQSLKAANIPTAIATSTSRLNVEAIIDATGWESRFAAAVTAEDVTEGKPAPEVFLKAAARLEVAPERSIVFEDAHVGIEAAKAAGMKVVAVTTTHPAETLADADRVVARLDELSPDQLGAWFS